MSAIHGNCSAGLLCNGLCRPDGPRNAGISLGLSIPLGAGVTASSGASRDQSGLTVAGDVTKPLGQEPGSFGWRVSDLEGEQSLRSASAAYRGDYGKVEMTATQSQTGFAGTISQEGAIVAAGGDVFFANRIDDAFAIVDAGAPGLEVSFENRPVARTDASGKAIVPTLNASQPNKISIDPRDLPLNASIATTQELLAPPDRSGVLVDFGIRTDVRSAIVILNRANGQPLQAGLRGKTAGGRGFVVGYDGRAFLEGIEANNIAIVELPGGNAAWNSPMRRKATARSRSDRWFANEDVFPFDHCRDRRSFPVRLRLLFRRACANMQPQMGCNGGRA